MSQLTFPWMYVADNTQGKPIALGSMYFGQTNLDPEIPANQIPVSAKQEDGTIVPLTQPVLLNAGGVPTYDGSPVILEIDADVYETFSWKVLNALGGQEYYNETNRPLQWDSGNIADGAITTTKIEDAAVTTPKLADGSVTTVKLDQTVGTEAVDTATIRDGAVTNPKLAVDSVSGGAGSGTNVIEAGSITGTEIGVGTIASGNIGNAQVGTAQLASGSVDTSRMAAPVANGENYGVGFLMKRFTGSGSTFSNSAGFPSNTTIFYSGGADMIEKKRCGCTALIDGSITVEFNLANTGIGGTASARVMKNGAIQGALFNAGSGANINCARDVIVGQGDVIEIHTGSTSLAAATLNNAVVRSTVKTPAIA